MIFSVDDTLCIFSSKVAIQKISCFGRKLHIHPSGGSLHDMGRPSLNDGRCLPPVHELGSSNQDREHHGEEAEDTEHCQRF